MPSENKTPNIGLNQWQGNEYPKRQDFVDDNLLIDTKIKENADNIKALDQSVNTHLAENVQQFATKMDKSGGVFTGIVTAQSNTSYTVRQIHNIILSTADADINSMQNGDIWIKYV